MTKKKSIKKSMINDKDIYFQAHEILNKKLAKLGYDNLEYAYQDVDNAYEIMAYAHIFKQRFSLQMCNPNTGRFQGFVLLKMPLPPLSVRHSKSYVKKLAKNAIKTIFELANTYNICLGTQVLLIRHKMTLEQLLIESELDVSKKS